MTNNMTDIEFLALLLSGWGFSWIVGRAHISYLGFRRHLAPDGLLIKFVECPGCTGFWFGVAVSGVLFLSSSPLQVVLLYALQQAGFNALLIAVYDHFTES